jgi:cell division protein FtsL
MKQTNLMQAHRQTPWRIQLQVIGVFLLILVMIAIIAGIYLNVTARAATIGRKIQGMQAEIQLNDRLNADLQTKLALLTTASSMEERAEELGFRPADASEITYIFVPEYAGRSPVVLAPPPGPVGLSTQILPPEFTESLIDWFRQLTLRPPLRLNQDSP